MCNWTNAQATNQDTLFPIAGTVRNVYMILSSAPGAGAGWSFQVFKNGSATALAWEIFGTDTTVYTQGVNVTLAAGDRLFIRATPINTPASGVGANWSFEYDTGNSTNFALPCGAIGTMGTAGGQLFTDPSAAAQTFSGITWVAESGLRAIVPMACTLKSFCTHAWPKGATSSRVIHFPFFVNGIEDATSIISVTNSSAANVQGLSIALNAGDPHPPT